MADYKHDAAISFLNQDLGVATEIRALVEPRYSVWIYSEKQRELAGTNGIPSFSDVFGRDSRLVVVMHRAGWGESGWTAVEREAIDARRLREGSEFLLFVRVDDSELPSWLPPTRIWTRLDALGVKGLAAVVEDRIAALGAKKAPERAEDIAVRIQLRQQRAAERDLRLINEGQAIVRAEMEKTRQTLRLASDRCGFAYSEQPDACLLYRDRLSVSVSIPPYAPLRQEKFYAYVKTWRGRPHIGGRFFGEHEELSCESYILDIVETDVIAWRHEADDTRLLTTESLADDAALTLMRMVEEQHERESRERRQ